MDGHDADAGAVRVGRRLLGIALVALLAFLADPVDQAEQVAVLAVADALQRAHHVPQGRQPLGRGVVVQRRQQQAGFFEHRLEQGGPLPGLGKLQPALIELAGGVGQRQILAAHQLRRPHAKEAGQQRLAERRALLRPGEAEEQRFELQHLRRLPETGLAMEAVRNAKVVERGGERLGLAALEDEDANVRRLERPFDLLVLEGKRRLRAGAVQEPLDLAGHEAGVLLACLLEPFPGAQVDDRHCRAIGQVGDDARLAFFVPGRVDIEVANAGLLRKPVAVEEETIERFEQVRRRAPVGLQRKERGAGLAGHLIAGTDIGRQVGAAEREDRLLGIADDEQPGHARVQENAAKDAPLQRVGVLELVDDAEAIAFPQPVDEVRRIGVALGVEAFLDGADHVVEALQATLALVFDKVAAERPDGENFELASPVRAGLVEPLPPIGNRGGPKLMVAARVILGGHLANPLVPDRGRGPAETRPLQHVAQLITEVRAPQLALHLAQHRRQQVHVVDERGPEVLSLFQRILLQEALAEAVDGEDRRLVEMIERRQQQGPALGLVPDGALQRVPQPGLETRRSPFR